MTFLELKTELLARGFDYLSTTRSGYFVNRAYQEMCAEEDWPFLESSSSGTAPLTVSDLRTVEAVINTTQRYKLRPLDRRNITDFDTDLTTTGTPSWYYLTTSTTVAVYPANTTDTIAVRYWKVPTALSADGDTPVVPTSYQQVIVDGACAYAYFDSDNFEAARSYLELFESGKSRMRDALLVGQHDEPDDMIVGYVDHQDATL